MNSLRLRIALVSFMVAVPLSASAYRLIQNTTTGTVTNGFEVACSAPGGFAHWTNNGVINYYLNTAGQGSGKAAAIQAAMASWAAVSAANHVPTYAGTSVLGWATNGTNSIVFASGNGCTGSCLALTSLVLQSGQVIVESDITFNADYTWNTDGNPYDTQAVATHELGHSLGIHHTDLTTAVPTPTMLISYFGPAAASLETDDQSALQCAEQNYPLGDPGAPSAPGSLNYLGNCFNQNRISWSSSAGATSYQVWISPNSNFAAPALYSSGAGTSQIVTTTSTKYVKTKACNASGCGKFTSAQKTVVSTGSCTW